MNYFGLDKEFSDINKAKVVIIPVPYEATTSYGKGTKNGPEAMLVASQQVELFDQEKWTTPYKIGIASHDPIFIDPVNNYTQKPFESLQNAVATVLQNQQFPIVLGGEHSLSIGSVKACANMYEDLSILHIDAHADLRSSYEDNDYSHATASYQMYKLLSKPAITQVGIRNISEGEVAWLQEEKPNINIHWSHQLQSCNWEEVVANLSQHVYLTIDVDGLDPSIMPSTGTPEPDGMTFRQLIDLIDVLCLNKTVVAADIVELAPITGLHAPDFLAAKLLYKLIGSKFQTTLTKERILIGECSK